MTNYVIVDTVSLVNLAKASLNNQQYLDAFLASTNSKLVLTDTVIGEATFNLLFEDAKFINNWVNTNISLGNIEKFTSSVATGDNAGEYSIVEFINTISSTDNRIIAVTDEWRASALIGNSLLSNGFFGSSKVLTTTDYLSQLIVDGDISLEYAVQALVDGLNAGRLTNFVPDPLNDIIWSGSIGTPSLGKTVLTGIPGYTVEYPAIGLQYVTTQSGGQYDYAAPPPLLLIIPVSPAPKPSLQPILAV